MRDLSDNVYLESYGKSFQPVLKAVNEASNNYDWIIPRLKNLVEALEYDQAQEKKRVNGFLDQMEKNRQEEKDLLAKINLIDEWENENNE